MDANNFAQQLARISHPNDKPLLDLCSHKVFSSLGNTTRILLNQKISCNNKPLRNHLASGEKCEREQRSAAPCSAMRTLAVIVFLISTLVGCTASKPLYYWGGYEELLYSRFVNPGEADPATQITEITQDIQIAQDNGQRVPPGIHAHLGYMLYTQGNVNAALQSLKTEKALYPEASIFVDRMIDQLTQ